MENKSLYQVGSSVDACGGDALSNHEQDMDVEDMLKHGLLEPRPLPWNHKHHKCIPLQSSVFRSLSPLRTMSYDTGEGRDGTTTSNASLLELLQKVIAQNPGINLNNIKDMVASADASHADVSSKNGSNLKVSTNESLHQKRPAPMMNSEHLASTGCKVLGKSPPSQMYQEDGAPSSKRHRMSTEVTLPLPSHDQQNQDRVSPVKVNSNVPVVDVTPTTMEQRHQQQFESHRGGRGHQHALNHHIMGRNGSQSPMPRSVSDRSDDNLSDTDHPTSVSNGGDGSTMDRFCHYHADQWSAMLEELLEYKRIHGHCLVAYTSKERPTLGRWVKRQRYQYRLMMEGKPESTMTPERAQILEDAGFVWDSHKFTWQVRFQELKAFVAEFGHANVPSDYPPNRQLSTWVKFQRRTYKASIMGLDGSDASARDIPTSRDGDRDEKEQQHRGSAHHGTTMTVERIRALEALGFTWELRRRKSKQR